jgi:preprotein translocase subunit YajC
MHLQHGAMAAWLAFGQNDGPPMAGEQSGTATGEGSPLPANQPGGGTTSGAPNYMPFILIGLFLVMFLVMSTSSQRKERKRRNEMLESLRKNDRVQTTGGMLGRIVEVKGDEVVLKVDDASNTRIRFVKSSIQTVLKQAAQDGATEADATK